VKLRAWFEKMEYPLRLEIIFLEYPLIRCQKSLELVLSSIFFP
jgi:tRNA A22 N-methylase